METPLEWHRQTGESEKAFDAFQRYLALGPERSVDALRRSYAESAIKKSNRLLQGWSSQWRWLARCKAHADHVAAIENASRDKVRAEEAEKWERRRIQAAASNWKNSQLLARKAAEMLASPLYEDTIDEIDAAGNPVRITRNPAKWTFGASAQIHKVAAELQAAAIAEATGSSDDGFDPVTASPEECRAYLDRQGLKIATGIAGTSK